MTSGPVAALAQNPMDPALLRTHHGRQRSYSAADTCAAPARELRWGTTYLHTAVLTGLTPGERYFYQASCRLLAAGGSGNGACMACYHCRGLASALPDQACHLPPPPLQVEGGAPMEFSAPVPTGPTHSFTFLVYGDMGESDHREAKSPG